MVFICSSYHYSHHPSSLSLFLSPKKPFSPLSFFFFSSSSSSSSSYPHKTPHNFPRNPLNPKKTSSSYWLHKWPSQNTPPLHSHSQNAPTTLPPSPSPSPKSHSAIERIVHRLRNLGIDSDNEDQHNSIDNDIDSSLPPDADDKLGHLLARSWVRPDKIVGAGDGRHVEDLLPWEREEAGFGIGIGIDSEEGGDKEKKRRRAKAPSLAELTIEDEELRRLRRQGMVLRERVTVPKAGVTQPVLEKIHQTWRKSELVRLKFHEDIAQNMKLAHELVELRTRGLVIWRSGSVMVVYRGSNYEWPSSKSQSLKNQSNSSDDGDKLYVPDVSSAKDPVTEISGVASASAEERLKTPTADPAHAERISEEEAEYNSLLDGLGPRFVEWWGTGVLPVDADLLPAHIPGYKTPFRLLPTGMRSRLTNAEMTSLRKLAKSLPCHFALGRNRNHQGLAAAIVKLWEKSIIVKIAVKRGIQNTNNKLMAEELKMLTGGVLLLRNKFYIVIYRGKDFVPTSVAAVLAEREVLTKDSQDVEEKARVANVYSKRLDATLDEGAPSAKYEIDGEEKVDVTAVETPLTGTVEGPALAGTLAESLEAQARWGREISADEYEKMKEASARAKTEKMMKRIDHKIQIAQAKKLRAEKLLSKIEASMVPAGPSDDQETITDEERFMFRRVGLRMKAYLPLGIRGVFDGVIENMHLHWKHRELVKLISKQKTLSFVEDTARLLEYESGGILVAIERVPKGYALIYYRGKNYQRPISIRPRNLLTKAKALKRSVAMQRHEALSQHISELEGNIEKLKLELGVSEDIEGDSSWKSEESEDEDSFRKDSDDDNSDDDFDDDEDDDD